MHNKNKNLSAGFTLVEIILAVSIFSLLIFAFAQLAISLVEKPKAYLSVMDNIDKARFVSSAFANEVRAAAFGPYPLAEAGNSQITFYTTIGAAENTVNRIRYYVADNILYKGVIIPVGGVYNPAQETITAVLAGVNNGEDPLFYYYDGDYDGDPVTHPALTQPVNVNQVKFVEISLKVLNRATTQDATEFSMVAGAAIRSLKENLTDE